MKQQYSRRLWPLWVVLSACGTPHEPRGPTTGTDPADTPADTHLPGTTSAASTPTGTTSTGTTPSGTTTGTTPSGTTPTGTTTTDWVCPPLEAFDVGQGPSLKLCGTPGPGGKLGHLLQALGPTRGGTRDSLFATYVTHVYDDPFRYSISTQVDGAGTASWHDRIDGEVGPCVANGYSAPAGDVNRDGYHDFWMGPFLFHGPFDGPTPCDEAAATIEDPVGLVVVGEFDADGDGWTDVAMGAHYQRLTVHYGPFEGTIPGRFSPAFDPSRVTTYDTLGCLEDFPQAWNLGALAGPGSAVLAVGENWSYSCREPIQIVDLAGPRGRALTLDDRLAWMDGADHPEAIGDWDGDGHPDLYVSHNRILRGPVVGMVDLLPPLYREEMDPLDFKILDLVDDLTGDGKPELIVYTAKDGGTYLVPSTIPPDAYVDVPTVGVRLAFPYRTIANHTVTGDFDGDGRGDFAAANPEADDGAGAIYVWFGRDFVFPGG